MKTPGALESQARRKADRCGLVLHKDRGGNRGYYLVDVRYGGLTWPYSWGNGLRLGAELDDVVEFLEWWSAEQEA